MWFVLVALLAQSADFEAEGIKALEAQKYDVAIDLLSKAVTAHPEDYNLRFQLGLAYSLLGKDAEAIPQYQAVLNLKPGLYQAEVNLGMSLLRMKAPADAIPYLKAASLQKPNEFSLLFDLAEAQIQAGQFADAQASYIGALGLNGGSAAAELGLAQTLARQGHRPEAEPHFRKAAALDPAYKDAPLELAELYESNHQLNEAIAIYRDFPSNPAAQERIGALLLELGRPADAIPPLEISVAKSPNSANRLALAQAYVKNKQLDKATPLAAAALAAEPRDIPLRMFYGRLLRDQRKFPDAAAQFQEVAQLKPDSSEAWSELSGVLILLEQYPQALAALDRVKSLGAENAGHRYFRAVVLDHLHQLKEALQSYNQFLEVSHGGNPDQEFLARQRVRIIMNELGKR